MIINPITPSHISQITSLSRTNRNAKPSFVSNPLSGVSDYGIAFKSAANMEINNPYEKGYEDIELDSEGKIKNNSKYLVINTAEQFSALGKTPSAHNRYYILNNDLDMQGYDFSPIGTYQKPFCGIFNGNGHTIKNLAIRSDKSDIGMFGSTLNAKITNLKIKDINIEGNNNVGGLIGNAAKTNVSNCEIDGLIKGVAGIGGFIGTGEFNTLDTVFFSGEIADIMGDSKGGLFSESSREAEKIGYIGGILGLDNGSSIKGAFFNGKITAETNLGGIIGATGKMTPSIIEDSVVEGKLISGLPCGAGVGNNGLVSVTRMVAMGYDICGTGAAPQTFDCKTTPNSLLSVSRDFYLSKYWFCQDKRLPRLRQTIDMYKPQEIFLRDVNISRKTGEIENGSQSYKPSENMYLDMQIIKPKHYAENDDLLKEIRTSENSAWLFDTFAEYTNKLTGYNYDGKDYDEIILALVKNPHLPVNRKYNAYGEATACTPLYIASRINKPYIFAEMLKRKDIEIDKYCGVYDDVNVLRTMQEYPEDTSAYVLYASENPKVKSYLSENVPKYADRKSYSKLLNLLNKTYPEIPKYDAEKQKLVIPKKYLPEFDHTIRVKGYDSNNTGMYCLDDVLRNMDVPKDYTDISGNNIINVAAELEDELYALTIFRQAVAIGVYPNNKNNFNYTPLKKLLETGKNQSVTTELIKILPALMYVTNESGENAIHIFSKNSDERKAIKYIFDMTELGMSVNMQDENGITALMNAIETKKRNLFKFLINKKANINLTDSNGQNALHYACINCDRIEDLEYIRILLDQNINPFIKDNNGMLPYDYLSEDMKKLVNMSQEELNDILAKAGADKEIEAVEYNSRSEFIKESGIISDDSRIYKMPQTTKESKEFQEFLRALACKNRSFYKGKSSYWTHLLAKTHNPLAMECLAKLFQNEPGLVNVLNDLEETPLMTAIDSYEFAKNDFEKQCCIDNINTIIENKADVNLTDTNGQNIMHRICQLESLYLISRFLDLNVNINQKDVLGKNPIEYLSKDITNKMRNYYENFARSKSLTLGIENILKGVKR